MFECKIDFSFSNYKNEDPKYNYYLIRSTEKYLKDMIISDGIIFLKDVLKTFGFSIKSCKEYGVPKARLSKSFTSNFSIDVDDVENPKMIIIKGDYYDDTRRT